MLDKISYFHRINDSNTDHNDTVYNVAVSELYIVRDDLQIIIYEKASLLT